MKDFCLTLCLFLGRNPSNFWFTFWNKLFSHKFILNLTDLYLTAKKSVIAIKSTHMSLLSHMSNGCERLIVYGRQTQFRTDSNQCLRYETRHSTFFILPLLIRDHPCITCAHFFVLFWTHPLCRHAIILNPLNNFADVIDGWSITILYFRQNLL